MTSVTSLACLPFTKPSVQKSLNPPFVPPAISSAIITVTSSHNILPACPMTPLPPSLQQPVWQPVTPVQQPAFTRVQASSSVQQVASSPFIYQPVIAPPTTPRMSNSPPPLPPPISSAFIDLTVTSSQNIPSPVWQPVNYVHQPVTQPAVTYFQQPAVTPVQQPAVNYVHQSVTQPAVTYVQQPAVTPVQQPVTCVQQPAVAPVQQQAVTPVQQPVTPVQQPVTPVQQPVTPVQQPVTPVQQPVTPVQQPVTPVQQPAFTHVQQPAFTHVQQPVFTPAPFIYQPVIAPSTTPPLSHSPPPLPPPICNLQPTVQVSQSPKLQEEPLLDPDVVVRKYPKYRNVSQAGRLAVRLAVESYFGTEMLRQSTVCGLKSHKPLPVEKVDALKQKMLTLHSDSKVEFEALWTKCINAINHHASGLRKKSLMH